MEVSSEEKSPLNDWSPFSFNERPPPMTFGVPAKFPKPVLPTCPSHISAFSGHAQSSIFPVVPHGESMFPDHQIKTESPSQRGSGMHPPDGRIERLDLANPANFYECFPEWNPANFYDMANQSRPSSMDSMDPARQRQMQLQQAFYCSVRMQQLKHQNQILRACLDARDKKTKGAMAFPAGFPSEEIPRIPPCTETGDLENSLPPRMVTPPPPAGLVDASPPPRIGMISLPDDGHFGVKMEMSPPHKANRELKRARVEEMFSPENEPKKKKKRRDIWHGATAEILDALKRSPKQTATCKTLAKMCNKPYQKVRGNVRHLKGQGRVQHIGNVRVKEHGERSAILFLYKFVR